MVSMLDDSIGLSSMQCDGPFACGVAQIVSRKWLKVMYDVRDKNAGVRNRDQRAGSSLSLGVRKMN